MPICIRKTKQNQNKPSQTHSWSSYGKAQKFNLNKKKETQPRGKCDCPDSSQHLPSIPPGNKPHIIEVFWGWMCNHLNANKTSEKADCKERSAPGLAGNEQEVQMNSAKLKRSFSALTHGHLHIRKTKHLPHLRSTSIPFKPLQKPRG